MEIIYPEDLQDTLLTELISDDFDRVIGALSVLRNYQWLGDDKQVRDLIYPVLDWNASGYRKLAAEVLVKMGDPLGILHLTYDALRFHPILGCDNSHVSGWSDSMILRNIEKLTEECISLLIDDMKNPAKGTLHADVLARAPQKNLILSRAYELLESSSDLVVAQAAYILARNGKTEGRKQLLSYFKRCDDRFIELALVGLSHVPNDEVVFKIKQLAEGNAIFDRLYDFKHGEIYKRQIQTKALQRSKVLEGLTNTSFLNIMEQFYTTMERSYTYTVSEFLQKRGFDIPKDYQSKLFIYDIHGVTATPDFINEFADLPLKQTLYKVQKQRINELFNFIPDNECYKLWDFLFLRRSSRLCFKYQPYLSDVKGYNEKENIIFSATDWLLHPNKYCAGSVGYYAYTWDNWEKPEKKGSKGITH